MGTYVLTKLLCIICIRFYMEDFGFVFVRIQSYSFHSWWCQLPASFLDLNFISSKIYLTIRAQLSRLATISASGFTVVFQKFVLTYISKNWSFRTWEYTLYHLFTYKMYSLLKVKRRERDIITYSTYRNSIFNKGSPRSYVYFQYFSVHKKRQK